jgi:5-methylcytosine-specific restriction endonuclease McrA
MALKPCHDCGRLATGSRCRICTATRNGSKPYTTPEWRKLSFAVVKRDRACVQCGSTFLLSAHHIVPRAEGGRDAPENLEALCIACHGRETAAERESRRWRAGKKTVETWGPGVCQSRDHFGYGRP